MGAPHHALLPAFEFGLMCVCAGEDGVSIQPVVNKLKSAHIGAILDYAAEADVGDKRRTDIEVPFHWV